ncbi:MAG: universal stress protein [Marinibacterium sp.]|nr:universal stress protein [Marinibacterium sp.]
MIKSIVVASDLSPRSEHALHRALRLAAQHDAALTIVYVVDDDLPAHLAKMMREAAEPELARQVAALSDRPVTIKVLDGDPKQLVRSEIKELDADLLVVGTHRPRPILDLLFSTTVEQIVRDSRRPVLLVKEPVTGDYERLLVGVDLSPACAAALRFGTGLAPGAQVDTFHGVSVPFSGHGRVRISRLELDAHLDEAQAALDDWWGGLDLPGTSPAPRAEEGGRGPLLAAKLATGRPDLVVVGAHGRAALSPTLLGGFTHELIIDPPTDLLVVRR